MSSLQSRLRYRTALLKRKLFDNQVKQTGDTIQLVRLTIEEDIYGNRGYVATSQEIITGIVSIPSNEVLLWENTNNPAEGSGIGIYDILPIEAWFQLDTNVQKGDIIILKYLLDPRTKDFKLIPLQVVNKVGRIANALVWTKWILAPYTLNLEDFPELTTILNRYKALDVEGLEQLTL